VGLPGGSAAVADNATPVHKKFESCMKLWFWPAAVLLLLLSGCARQGNVTGGPKDTTPPGLDTLKSSPLYPLRFKERYIRLTFDEWVVLKNATQQVVISPPLAKNPKATLDKKTVVVDLGENVELRPNTTYTIQFGTAVADFHADNIAKDLRYVFSTGDLIDSMKVSGVAIDAFSAAPIENVTVMLYESESDSVVVREKPYYYARTDKNGQFTINNIKPGRFRCVGVDEGQTPDLKWQPKERIAPNDKWIVLSDSVSSQTAILKLYVNQAAPRRTDVNATRFGLIRLAYNTRLDTLPAFSPISEQGVIADSLKWRIERSDDSLLFWYDYPATTPVAWKLKIGERDTVPIKAINRADFVTKNKLMPADQVRPASKGGRISSNNRTPTTPPAGGAVTPPTTPVPAPVKVVTQHFKQPFNWDFNIPIEAMDTTKWILMRDTVSLRTFTVTQDSLRPRRLIFEKVWVPDASYQLMLLPGAITGWWQAANVDTLRLTFNVIGEKQLGTLNLSVENIQPGQSYLLQLLNGKNVVEERRFKAGATMEKLIFKHLPTAKYTAQLIEDRNRNGRWDTGNYFESRSPEAVWRKELEALKANWELEAVFDASDTKGKKKK
jgi:Bacterial Ig-like domain